MNRLPDNELLSAYLDGELSADEKAEVERVLAEDPAARQLLGELRAVKSAVRGLPAYELHEDLTDSVLQAAQWQLLSGNADTAALSAQPSAGWRVVVRRVLQPRRLIWSAVAIAAAVLIMLWHPDQPGKVAQHGQQQPQAAQNQAQNGNPNEVPQVAAAPSGQQPAARSDGLFVVRLEIAGSAARQKAFENLLSSHGIAQGQATDNPASLLAQSVDGPSATARKVSPQAAKPIYVQVEATPAQIDALLAELKANHTEFRDLRLEGSASEPASGKRKVVFVLRVVP